MNRKGQALIEFVLILPLFILILFAIIDFGLIMSKKNELENMSIDVVTLIKNGKNIDEINNMYSDVLITKEDGNDFVKIKLSENISVMTPGLNLILGNPYKIEIERNIPNVT